MNAWIRRSLQVSIVAAGFLAAGATAAAAHAGPDLDTQDNYGIGNGNQVVAPIQAPIDACGNAVSGIGAADAACEGGSTAVNKHFDPELDSRDNYGIGNGNQGVAPIQVPIDVCGNAGAAVGESDAMCVGGSDALLK